MGLLIRGESVSYTHLTAAEGNGPVNAMDIALRKAILQFFPELERVSLKMCIRDRCVGDRGARLEGRQNAG